MNAYLGIDVGTSSAKALLMREDGAVIATAWREYDILRRRPEYGEQNMETIWQAVKQAVGEISSRCPSEAAQIRGISYSGQMHGLVTVDEDGKLVRDAIIWADQRVGKEEMDAIYRQVGREFIHETALNDLASGFLLCSLVWLREHEPEHYSRTAKVLLPKDYIRFRMCGKMGTDHSDASGTMAFDVRNRQWAWEILDRLGLDRPLFPESRESWETAGELLPEPAREMGLKPGIPITYGGGDSLMQEIGNGVVSRGDPWICNIGTSCSLNCAVETPVFDRQFRTNTFCHVKDSLWMLMGASMCGGIALKWLKNQMFFMDSYDQMTAEAAGVPAGSGGLLFLPSLNGSRCPVNDPGAKGVFAGLTLEHTRAHVIRSVMEGIVYGIRESMEIFQRLGIDTGRIIASGGGARGALFRQIEADILEREILTVEGEEQACMGAAITAAVGTGAYPSYREACREIIRFRPERTEPIRENAAVYRERYPVYCQMYRQTKPLF